MLRGKDLVHIIVCRPPRRSSYLLERPAPTDYRAGLLSPLLSSRTVRTTVSVRVTATSCSVQHSWDHSHSLQTSSLTTAGAVGLYSPGSCRTLLSCPAADQYKYQRMTWKTNVVVRDSPGLRSDTCHQAGDSWLAIPDATGSRLSPHYIVQRTDSYQVKTGILTHTAYTTLI